MNLYWSDELVVLLGRVLLDHARELERERVRVRREPLMVVWAELDHEVVGHHRATTADDRCPIVAFALERTCDLDGLYLRFERTREGATDEPFETALEPVENSHGHLLIAHRGGWIPSLCGGAPSLSPPC